MVGLGHREVLVGLHNAHEVVDRLFHELYLSVFAVRGAEVDHIRVMNDCTALGFDFLAVVARVARPLLAIAHAFALAV